MNVAMKQNGIATIQIGGSQSKIAQRLSIATRMSAEMEWIGGPSGGGSIFGAEATGGRTSTSICLAGVSASFGGVSMGERPIKLPLTSLHCYIVTRLHGYMLRLR